MSGAAQAGRPDDYVRDGVLCCGVCGKPRQTVVELDGERRVVSALCACQTDALERAWAHDRSRSRYLAAMQHPAAALDLRLKAKEERCHPAVLRYLSRWEEMARRNIGLLLWGDVGTGKTESAAWCVQALRARGVPCLLTSLGRLAGAGFALPPLNGFDLLALDDLGAERQSDYMLERAHGVIDERVGCGKPLIVTTNLSLRQMKQTDELKYRRLYDRVLSVCVPVRFAGESYRLAQKADRLQMAKEGLG